MGNSESKDEGSPAPRKAAHSQHTSHRRREPSRDSWRQDAGYNQGQGRSHSSRYSNTGTTTATPPPPTATAISVAPSTASTSTSNVNVTHTTTHTRTRSRTSVTSSLRAEDSASSQRSEKESMGNSESKEGRSVRPPSRSQTLPSPAAVESEKPAPSPSSQPVDVPQSNEEYSEKEIFRPSGLPEESPFALSAATRYDRPPRLPLPIEEELHTPGSPIISAADLPLSPADDASIPRRASVLSSTTADDEELTEDFTSEANALAPTVPTTLTWRGNSDKVFVTGTFVSWERKFKLHPDKENGGFSATVNLKPGTHHLKFLVRGDMTTSDALPTTVDYAGNFVNYIEVVAPPLPVSEQEPDAAEPMPTPGTAITAGQATATDEPAARPMDIRPAPTRIPETASGMPSTLQETIGHDGTRTPAHGAVKLPTPALQEQERRPTAPPRQKVPRPKYTSEIPPFLEDLDANADEDRMSRAKRVEPTLPPPPTLPMFLGKSILNGQMPHKDDASVLLMPNHTVLNHLATSSIKHGVLATSGTTRYKRKFLTTIMYKPTASGD